MDIKLPEDFIEWKTHKSTQSTIEARWNDHDLDFEWVFTVQTNEVPEDDPWNSFTTEQKRLLKNLHSAWNVPDSSTEHWMSFSPPLKNNLSCILDHFEFEFRSYNALKLTPGHMLVWHFDTYATFVNRQNISFNDMENVKRSVVMMTDWNCGQVIQIGNDMLHGWKRGDVYTWDSYVWHGTANFGNSDMIVLQISYLDDKQ